MKILLVHSRYRSKAPSGENNVVDRESALLATAGHQVELFQRTSDDIATWGPARKAALPARSIWNAQARKELAEHIEVFRPDLVHVHNTFPLISASALHACRDMGVPVVATIHNYKLVCASGDFFRAGRPCHDCSGGRLLPGLTHGCYRGSRLATAPVAGALTLNRPGWRSLVSAYIFISSSQRELMRGLDLPDDRVFVKHNFVPVAPTMDASPRDHCVVYLGRLDAAKGIPFLQSSWDAFREANPRSSLRLVIAGGGPLEDQVHRWAADRESVEYAGLLSSEAANRLLQRALAAVVPSQWEETFGLVAVEAMAAGVAPIAPAHGSFPELVTDGVDGALFTPHDPRDVARVLRQVDEDSECYIDYGRRGRATYEERFTPSANLEELLKVYSYALAHPASGRRPRSPIPTWKA